MNYEERTKENNIFWKKAGVANCYWVIVILYIMLGLYSVIRSLNYGKWLEGIFVGNLLFVTGMMILAAFAAWLLCLCFEYEEFCLKDFLAVFLSLLLIVYVDSNFLFHSIARGVSDSENRWIYELLILPVNAVFTLKLSMALENRWSLKNNFYALLSFISWNFFMGYISNELHMSYQGSLIVTNALIFGAVIFGAKTEKKNYGNRCTILGLYIIAMILSLYLKKDKYVSIRDYLFDEPGFSGYCESVRTLFSNVKWIGPAYDGICMELNLLKNSANPIHSICAYFGILPTVFYFVMLMIIMIIFGVALYRIRKESVYYVVGMSAYANLLMRMSLGTLFSFGLFPLQVEMPFAADENFIFDFCACAVLLMIYFKTTLFYKRSSFKEIIELLILNEEEEWEDIDYEEMY